MTQDSIRAFVRENFGKDYFPVYHGQSNIITPLALIVKRNRKWWRRPFGKAEMIVLAGLENYVMRDNIKLFHRASQAKLMKENKKLEKVEVAEVRRNLDMSIEGFDSGGLGLQVSDMLGDLDLGQLTEEYYLDPDLRDVLSVAALDSNKMAPLEGQHLLLVTGVMYSTKFALKGNRMHQTTISGNIHAPSEMAVWLGKNSWVKAHVTNTTVPHAMVNRNSRAPFLFKFCRVVYDKDSRRLKIPDGVFVGKRLRSVEKESNYEEAVLHLETAANLFQDHYIMTVEDCEKVENIKQFLITEEAGTQRKSLVLMYLQRFEAILTEEKKQLFIDKPLTSNDCAFLHKLGIRARPRQLFLRVDSVSRSVIQEYGIMFKLLSDLSEDMWKEFETTLTDSQEDWKY